MKSYVKYYNNHNKKIRWMFAFASILFVMSAFCSLMLGSSYLEPGQVIEAIVKKDIPGVAQRIVWYIRLPRTLACLVTGSALATAGAVIQSVFANKLASPSVIGVNAGAGLAVTVCTALGVYGGWKLSLGAFLGAFITVLVISLGARKWGASRGTVILIGVAVNSLLGAISDTIMTFEPDVAVMSQDFKIGDFSAVSYQKLIPATIIVGIVLVIVFTLSNELELISLGEENAGGLGLNINQMRVVFLLLSALLCGCAVSLAGLLSFVGLLVPHIIRRLGGTQAKVLLPLCVLFGGGFVTMCDLIARMAFAPYEIPVGIMMSFLGAPFFVFILIKGKGVKGEC